MCWRCDHPNATADDYLDELRKAVREHGWAVQYVESDRTPFGYTVGLHDCGLPELLVTGVSAPRAERLLNTVAKDMMGGRVLSPGQKIAVRSGPLIEVVEVANPDIHMEWAVAFGGQELRALQLVWADGRGRWPWAAAFSDGRGRQPVLGKRGPQNA
ncbi:DUF4262 domain-containing protein [Mycolicibacterium stellerae]|uniref:DUF4262 domain-containing protein n=1 Tax=Mycolicibacterium stellerae TaxID=2358193 RepID=UPI000F0BCC47|nr:DUF4262 domain-containing protein [Mycolicibacterium stellerae]